jgi:hypothetical protein
MSNAGEILKKFYDGVIKKDIASARNYLSNDLLFIGLFETYHGAEEYIKALTGLLQVTVRLDVKKIIGEEKDASVFFELETKEPAAAVTLVAEWHHVKNGKIIHVESAFDPRAFEAMFTGKKRA